jgi:hypothetical protein
LKGRLGPCTLIIEIDRIKVIFLSTDARFLSESYRICRYHRYKKDDVETAHGMTI